MYFLTLNNFLKMNLKWFLSIAICFILASIQVNAQDSIMVSTMNEHSCKVKGYHIGVVQPIVSFNKGEATNIFAYDKYAIGFPTGITLTTSSKLLIDLELVPFVAPLLEKRDNFEVHLLYHPGVLLPLDSGFTLGLRAAFESGTGQFGYTLLLNKAFDICNSTKFFVELVAPGRWGPNEKSGYTQVLALHLGLGF